MQKSEIIARMRARAAQCRRLARSTTDDRTAETLRAMAEEADADIARLLGQADEG